MWEVERNNEKTTEKRKETIQMRLNTETKCTNTKTKQEKRNVQHISWSVQMNWISLFSLNRVVLSHTKTFTYWAFGICQRVGKTLHRNNEVLSTHIYSRCDICTLYIFFIGASLFWTIVLVFSHFDGRHIIFRRSASKKGIYALSISHSLTHSQSKTTSTTTIITTEKSRIQREWETKRRHDMMKGLAKHRKLLWFSFRKQTNEPVAFCGCEILLLLDVLRNA